MPLKKPSYKILLTELARAVDAKIDQIDEKTANEEHKVKEDTGLGLGQTAAKKKKGKPKGPQYINTARLLTL